MPQLSTRQLVVYLAIGVAVVALGARWIRGAQHPSPAPAAPALGSAGAPALRLDQGGGAELVVDVAGAVRHPGVYRLAPGSRVDAALKRAGGPTRAADLTALNLASKLDDGRQVIVPTRTPAAGAMSGAAAAGGMAGSSPSAPIDLNSATVDQLTQLDGVGPATAQRIVAYRQQHGGFSSVDELDQVPGIGPKKLAAIRPHVTG